ncbi:MAG: SpoIID/LytB domain-containing protein [Thermoanaerobaculia bacterium]|nr:SpoIID/LytB domain-containing protein [Thermoanaerobaculia bacterium]
MEGWRRVRAAASSRSGDGAPGLLFRGLGLWLGGMVLAVALIVSCRPRAEPRAIPGEGPPVEPAEAPVAAEPSSETVAEPVREDLGVKEEVGGAEEVETPLPPVEPVVLKVGLQTDRPVVSLSCCGPLTVSVEGQKIVEASSVEIRPAAQAVTRPVFRLQVAALEDSGQAEKLSSRLRELTGWFTEMVPDAASGMHKVRVGAWQREEDAREGSRILRTHGVSEAWVISDGGELEEPALRLEAGERAWRIRGRWVRIEGSDGGGIRIGDHGYRGAILLYLNDRGLLNVVNEISLETYVRQVVPREMGPELYPELDALKAQAVAARTYTVRNLGEFLDEGYDICATPRCQVFGGMDAEHPRSDRAVRETEGQVMLWKDRPIDALYSSTCGGYTEDVSVVFPLKEGRPYLRGVPCIELGIQRLGGSIPPGRPLPEALTVRVFPGSSGAEDDPRAWGDRLRSLALEASLSPPTASLRSFEGRSVLEYLERIFDLALDRRLFLPPERLRFLVDDPPREWDRSCRRLAERFLAIGRKDPGVSLDPGERSALFYRLARYLGVLRSEPVRFLDLRGGTLVVRRNTSVETVPLSGDLATFQRQDEEAVSSVLALFPGDEVELVWRGDEPVAVVQRLVPEAGVPTRPSRRSSWRLVKSESELRTTVERRYPGFEVEDFEVLERGRSGRVGRLRLIGRDGRTEILEGLAVRWALDLPDTLFHARRLNPAEGVSGWLFTGRGWGHGVGLCQIGSVGMAQRGHDYRSILSHYYPGAILGRILGSRSSS